MDWIARIEGLSSNAALTHSASLLAEKLQWKGFTFDKCYHPNEGVWWCTLFLIGLTTSEDETRRSEFMSAHKPFFFTKHGNKWEPDERKIVILWSQVDYLVDHWFKRRELDAWSTGERMAEALKDAKIVPPPWGPKAEIER